MGIEQSLWNAANQLRANSKLKASEYASPVLGLIFLKFADYKFTLLEKEFSSKLSKKRKINILTFFWFCDINNSVLI